MVPVANKPRTGESSFVFLLPVMFTAHQHYNYNIIQMNNAEFLYFGTPAVLRLIVPSTFERYYKTYYKRSDIE